MNIVETPAELRALCDRVRAGGARVGFVPTMGALHAGHLALVHEAKKHAEFVVVSIFVNPTQFGPNEDFSRYPRTFADDRARCEEAGVDAIFAPAADAIYAPGDETRVSVGVTAQHLCGAHRPGHFEGVCTVVAKLFGLVGPSVAVFGRKDYQQWRVLLRMTNDLMLPVQVMGLPTVREPDGLAMSSRNRYLSESERDRALSLARGLSRAVRAFEEGERRAEVLRREVLALVEPAADVVDYVAVADPDRVVPFEDGALVGERALVAIAVKIGATRLIDNVVLGEEPAPIRS
jgi:pantoate--beta-alanine ligase